MVYSRIPVEPDFVTHFIHTKTFLSRGYDYELGFLSNKFKKDIIQGDLGRKIML